MNLGCLVQFFFTFSSPCRGWTSGIHSQVSHFNGSCCLFLFFFLRWLEFCTSSDAMSFYLHYMSLFFAGCRDIPFISWLLDAYICWVLCFSLQVVTPFHVVVLRGFLLLMARVPYCIIFCNFLGAGVTIWVL